jgi:replicative DNA helicase
MASDDFLVDPKNALFDLELEKMLLGSILVQNAALPEVAQEVHVEDFHRGMHRRIYKAMLDLYQEQEALTVLTLDRKLGDPERGQPSWASVLTGFIAETYSSAAVMSYARAVSNLAKLRRIRVAARKVDEAALANYQDADEGIRQALAAVGELAISLPGRGFVSIADLASVYYDRVSDLNAAYENGTVPDEGFRTGLIDLDEATGGLQRGDLIILAARPGMGKTALAMQIASQVADQRYGVAVFSLEMSRNHLIHRFVAGRTGVDGFRLRTGKLRENELEMVAEACGEIANLPIWIDDTAGATVIDVRGRVQSFLNKMSMDRYGPEGVLRPDVTNLGLIVVDYLQLMAGVTKRSQDGRVQEIGEISRGLKGIAREFEVPVIACAQLNRAIDYRTDHRPMLSDLRESGSIEADADLIWFLTRDDRYNPDSPKKGIVDFNMAKHRNGPLAEFELLFDGPRTMFLNLDKTGRAPSVSDLWPSP